MEISSPGDPFAGESVRRAPGWPDQDVEILDDNNKAQRNMGPSTTPARGIEAAETCICALVHNAAIATVDFFEMGDGAAVNGFGLGTRLHDKSRCWGT